MRQIDEAVIVEYFDLADVATVDVSLVGNCTNDMFRFYPVGAADLYPVACQIGIGGNPLAAAGIA